MHAAKQNYKFRVDKTPQRRTTTAARRREAAEDENCPAPVKAAIIIVLCLLVSAATLLHAPAGLQKCVVLPCKIKRTMA